MLNMKHNIVIGNEHFIDENLKLYYLYWVIKNNHDVLLSRRKTKVGTHKILILFHLFIRYYHIIVAAIILTCET